MKISELHETIFWEDDDIALTGSVINESLQLTLEGKGKFLKDIDAIAKKGLNKAGMIGAYAYDQLKRYKKQRYKTISFFARKTREKRTYEKLIKTLTDTGKYKVIRTFPYKSGGKMWELKKI